MSDDLISRQAAIDIAFRNPFFFRFAYGRT